MPISAPGQHDTMENQDVHLSTGPVTRTVHPELKSGTSFFNNRLGRLIGGIGALIAGEEMGSIHPDVMHEPTAIVSVIDDSADLPESPTEITNSPSAGPMENLTMTAAELVGDQTQDFQNFYTTYSTFDAYQAPTDSVVA